MSYGCVLVLSRRRTSNREYQFADGKVNHKLSAITLYLLYTEPMYCEPKSIAKRLIMSLQKTFGVYSEPIAILLAILIGVASLYVLLIPGGIVSVLFLPFTVYY